jgi:CBS domain containing-hemolysin-like protein
MSGMEAGLFKLNRLRLKNLERSGDKRAKLLSGYLDRPEQFLWTILVGNILANFVILCLTAFFLNKYFEFSKILFWLVYFLTIFIFYLTCDLMPKILFRIYANSLCILILYPFRVLYLCLSPAVWIITKTAHLIMQWTGGRSYTEKYLQVARRLDTL